MIKTLTLLFLLLIAIPATYAQEKEPRFQKELKLNVSFLSTESGYTLGSLAPVLLLKNKQHHRHEFELNRFGFSKKVEEKAPRNGSPYEDTDANYSLGLRYQYTHSFSSGGKIDPFVGGALLTTWSGRSYETTGSTVLPNQLILNTNALELVPGFRWRFTERIGLDVSTIFYVFMHEFIYHKVENPALPIGAQQHAQSKSHSRPFDFFLSRVGFYIKL